MPLPLLQLVRVQNFPSALADVWAGYFLHLAWGGTLVLSHLGLLSLASVSLYGAGMALNDFVDFDRDLTLHPRRPLPSGRLRQGDALLTAAILLALAALAGMIVSETPALVCFALVGLVLAYDLFTKSVRWLGAVNMGLLRAGNLFLGMSVGLDRLPGDGDFIPGAPLGLFPALLGAHVFLLTLLSTYEEDRFAAGAVRFLFVVHLAVLCVPVALFFGDGAAPWLAMALVVGFGAIGLGALRRSTTAAIPRIIVAGIRGIIVLDAVFVLGHGETALGLLVLSLLVPAMALGMAFRGS